MLNVLHVSWLSIILFGLSNFSRKKCKMSSQSSNVWVGNRFHVSPYPQSWYFIVLIVCLDCYDLKQNVATSLYSMILSFVFQFMTHLKSLPLSLIDIPSKCTLLHTPYQSLNCTLFSNMVYLLLSYLMGLKHSQVLLYCNVVSITFYKLQFFRKFSCFVTLFKHVSLYWCAFVMNMVK